MIGNVLPISPRKRGAVGAYLCRHFSEYKMGDRYDCLSDTYVYRLSKRGARLVLEVRGDFLKDRRVEDISRDLAKRNVAALLHELGSALLTDRGMECSPGMTTALGAGNGRHSGATVMAPR